jgi:hypothetical protein
MGLEPVTALFLRWRGGDRECLNRLLPQVEGNCGELQTTALVHEAYLKLVDQAPVLPLEENLVFSPQKSAPVALDDARNELAGSIHARRRSWNWGTLAG